jgi:hypothetical protein
MATHTGLTANQITKTKSFHGIESKWQFKFSNWFRPGQVSECEQDKTCDDEDGESLLVDLQHHFSWIKPLSEGPIRLSTREPVQTTELLLLGHFLSTRGKKHRRRPSYPKTSSAMATNNSVYQLRFYRLGAMIGQGNPQTTIYLLMSFTPNLLGRSSFFFPRESRLIVGVIRRVSYHKWKEMMYPQL